MAAVVSAAHVAPLGAVILSGFYVVAYWNDYPLTFGHFPFALLFVFSN